MSIRNLKAFGLGSLLLMAFGCSAEAGENFESQESQSTQQAIVVSPQKLHVVGVTSSGGLRHALRTGTSWSGFGDVEGQAGDIGTVTDAQAEISLGGLHVIAIAGGALFHTIRSETSWQPFVNMAVPLGTVGTYNSVALANGTAGTHVCVTTTAGGLFHTIRSSTSWQPWGDVKLASNSNPGSLKRVACSVHSVVVGQVPAPPGGISLPIFGDELHVVALTTSGVPYHAIRHPNGSWDTLNNVNVPTGNTTPFSDIDIDVDPNGELHVVGTGSNLQYHSFRTSGGWSVFGDIEQPAGDPGNQQSGAAVALDEGLYVFDQLSNGGLMMTRRGSGAWDAFMDVRVATGSTESFKKVSTAGESAVIGPN
ncbi:MAG TPA: hypothetical protein VFQ61_12185 [Polyangiaceae bacterium]|nr:hypothetical protein [Polyangiaceae bacterium]